MCGSELAHIEDFLTTQVYRSFRTSTVESNCFSFAFSIHILEQNWHVMYKLRHSSHKKSKFPAQLPSAGFYNSVKPNVYNFNIKKKQSISDSIPNESFSGFCENARNENYMEILSFPDTTTNSIFSSYFNANKVVEIAPLNGGFRVLSNS